MAVFCRCKQTIYFMTYFHVGLILNLLLQEIQSAQTKYLKIVLTKSRQRHVFCFKQGQRNNRLFLLRQIQAVYHKK